MTVQTNYDLTEFLTLINHLTVLNIPFSVKLLYDGWQVVVDNGSEKWDAIIHHGSYGHSEGLLEIYGSIVDEETDGDSVVGYLTALDILERLPQYQKLADIESNENVLNMRGDDYGNKEADKRKE